MVYNSTTIEMQPAAPPARTTRAGLHYSMVDTDDQQQAARHQEGARVTTTKAAEIPLSRSASLRHWARRSIRRTQRRMSTASAATRIAFLAIAAIVTLAAAGLTLYACLTSNMRTIVDRDRNTDIKYYVGLFRLCYVHLSADGSQFYAWQRPSQPMTTAVDDSSCRVRRAAARNEPGSREAYEPWELTTLILLAVALLGALMALGFAVCAIFNRICSAAHSTLLCLSALTAIAGFAIYTYNSELYENQFETQFGHNLPYSTGLGYYLMGVAALLHLIAFFVSLVSTGLHFAQGSSDTRM